MRYDYPKKRSKYQPIVNILNDFVYKCVRVLGRSESKYEINYPLNKFHIVNIICLIMKVESALQKSHIKKELVRLHAHLMHLLIYELFSMKDFSAHFQSHSQKLNQVLL